ncbi:DUF4258 domain-containing protein [Patescibacteria group bacterium]|nr:DUF4258 domain-containing protein [Patescibacteria group bacterium]
MIFFSEHALLKLKQRNIPRIFVEKALMFPDYDFPSYSDRNIVYKKIGKLYLKVIFTKKDDNLFIITQHWEEKPKLIK